MADDKEPSVQLAILSGTFKKEDEQKRLQLIGVVGDEAISTLFEYRLLLQAKGGVLSDEELASLVTEPCVIALGPKEGDLVHGIITAVEHLDGSKDVTPRYVATMVPQVAVLGMGTRSAIYPETTIPQLAKDLLASYGLSEKTHFEVNVFDRDDEKKESPKHEYIVQYKESDWDFLSRWLEYEGYFYWFEHSKDGGKLVIADANDDTTPINDPNDIHYRGSNSLNTGEESTLWDFRLVQQRIPSRVVVLDYNYRTPGEVLVVGREVDQQGFGVHFHYGEHFKDKDVGKEIARVRAERHLTEQRTISGVTDCSRFRVGHSFELKRHHHDAYNGSYLITEMQHRVGYDVGAALAREGGDSAGTLHQYSATFRAIPLETPFRAERRVAWPRISGFVPGHIEADSDGAFAQIDSQGRYKVKFPFDVGTNHGLKASRWIRMAQHYAGDHYGTHFPLHKGTEVLVAHTDGDPDRPVIVASVPNPTTQSPVVAANATQSVMNTASGLRIEFEDQQK
ncbi:type VI secretion system tip protein VgrG [Endomicrobium sp. AH-315-J14]|nr:type VI secretion system tip protein VgrG [Endomicrobium sp. AH-315-J14]